MNKIGIALIVGALTLACAAQDSETVLKVDVKLVNVFVTVTDDRGATVSTEHEELRK